jgi:hypothetical protein
MPTDGELPTGAANVGEANQGVPLNLSLSQQVLKKLATPGIAANARLHARLPPTVEGQIAEAAAANGPWEEMERLDMDHVRLRRGNTCITLERPSAARIDPANDALQRLPWLANITNTDCH